MFHKENDRLVLTIMMLLIVMQIMMGAIMMTGILGCFNDKLQFKISN